MSFKKYALAALLAIAAMFAVAEPALAGGLCEKTMLATTPMPMAKRHVPSAAPAILLNSKESMLQGSNCRQTRRAVRPRRQPWPLLTGFAGRLATRISAAPLLPFAA